MSSINNGGSGPLTHGAHPAGGPLHPSGIKPTSRSTPRKTALSTNLLVSLETGAKKPYRPACSRTQRIANIRVLKTPLKNTKNGQHSCPKTPAQEHKEWPTFVSKNPHSRTQRMANICALSTNLLVSLETGAKKPYRPTSKASSPRIPRSTFLNTNIAQHLCPSKHFLNTNIAQHLCLSKHFLNTNIAQHLCPSKHFFEHEYCPNFALRMSF